MPAPRLSIVIVNWNSRDDLIECLQSLAEHPPRVAWEVIVVDNASRDGSVAALASEAGWARVIANRENRGLAAAINQGLGAGGGDVYLICNADILFRAGAIDALCDCLERHPKAAFVVPKTLLPDGRIQTAVGDLPTLLQSFVGRQFARSQGSRPSGFWWDGWAHDEEIQVGHGAEACYLVRRQAVDSIGALDEAFFLDWEGIDWSARAKAAGWEIWFCPTAEIVHKGGVSVTAAGAAWVIASHRGLYRYFRKRHGLPAVLAALPLAVRAAIKIVLLRAGVPFYRRAQTRGMVES